MRATNYGTSFFSASGRGSKVQPRQLQEALSGSAQLQKCKAKSYCSLKKGAAVTLLMSFCGYSMFHFLLSQENIINQEKIVNHDRANLTVHDSSMISPVVILAMCLLLYPFFSWLADVRYGKYKVIKWSLRVILVTLIIFCLISALSTRLPRTAIETIKIILYVALSLGLGGFQANITQFGIEQLLDASSGEIMSYVQWLTWSYFFSDIVINLTQSCLCSSYHHEALGFLVLPALITLAICAEVLFKHWLVEEPVPGNPFALIFKVLRYAIKNKHPRLRSAFTYWDDRKCHRIDLAKIRYGGPFTTEKVEDVKTFFRMASVISAGAFFIGLFLNMYPTYAKVFYHLYGNEFEQKECEYSYAYMGDCFRQNAIVSLGSLVIVIGIPLYRIILNPLLGRHLQVSIPKKLMIGTLVYFLSVASCAAVELAAQHIETQELNNTEPIFCPLGTKLKYIQRTSSLDSKWMVFPYLLETISQCIVLICTTEFLCAQSPYSMRGLLFGITYGAVGFFSVFGYALMLPVKILSEAKLSYRYGCLFWYLVFGLAVMVGSLILVVIVFKCYKKRAREYRDESE